MILTFKELGINAAQYNHWTFSAAHSAIVNIACDYIMLHHFPDRLEDDCIIDPIGATVNFVAQIVTITTIQPTLH